MPERTLCSQGNLIEVLIKPTPLIYALLFFGGGGGRLCHTTSAKTKFFACLFRLVLGYCCDQLGEAHPWDIRTGSAFLQVFENFKTLVSPVYKEGG